MNLNELLHTLTKPDEDGRSVIARSISFILVLMIGVFSFSSVGNVTEFIHKFHVGPTGWALGIGFGVTVFVAAYIAATTPSTKTRWWAIFVGAVFGLASGFFQSSLYIEGGASLHIAALLSFIPIIVGEIGIALLESSYSKDSRENVLMKLRVSYNALKEDLERALKNLTAAQTQAELVPNLQNSVNTLSEQLNAAQTELNKVKSEFDCAQNKVQNALNSSELELEQVRTELEQSKLEADSLRTQLNEVQQKADKYERKCNEAMTSLDEAQHRLSEYTRIAELMKTDSVLKRLNDSVRQKVEEALTLMESNQVAQASDLVSLGMNKASVYQVWPIITASMLVYENGDKTFHVNN